MMTTLSHLHKTADMNAAHTGPNLNYWRNSVLDYLDDGDETNLYFAAQKLNALAPADPVGLYGLSHAQWRRGELNTAYFNAIQARKQLEHVNTPISSEEALELEAVIAADLGHLAVALERYGELIELNPWEPRYVSARADLFESLGTLKSRSHTGVKKTTAECEDSSVANLQAGLFLQAAAAHAVELDGKPVYTSYESAAQAVAALRRIPNIQLASVGLRQRYAELNYAAQYSLRRNFVRYQWWQFCLYIILGMTLPSSMINNIAKDISEKGNAGIFSGMFTSAIMISLFTFIGLYFFYPLGHRYNARRVRKREAKLRSEFFEEPEQA